jgi:hypothetical protein
MTLRLAGAAPGTRRVRICSHHRSGRLDLWFLKPKIDPAHCPPDAAIVPDFVVRWLDRRRRGLDSF